jgi:hypothetical protein
MSRKKQIKLKMMKKTIVLGLFMMSILLISCSKDDDFTDPDNLSGTEWKSVVENQGHYYLLKFIGKTIYELYEYEPLDGLNLWVRGSYIIEGKSIVLEWDSGYKDKVTINGNKLTWPDLDVDGNDVIFTKQ